MARISEHFIIFVFLFVPAINGQSFLSKYFRGGSSKTDFTEMSCEENRVTPRIALAVVGGTPMESQMSAPYMVAVGGKTKNGSVEWFCGGSVLSATAILTAAHCVYSRTIDTVRVGSLTLHNMLTPNDYPVEDTIIHEDYQSPRAYNDLAILKLRDKLPFSYSVRPICLSSSSSEHVGKTVQVIGWGSEQVGGTGSPTLQQVDLEVFSNTRCNEAYKNSTATPRSLPEGISNEQLCAGSRVGGKDACQGDSGGPLVIQDDDGVIRQIGLVSVGEGCGISIYPGVYVRISSYTDWVQQQLKTLSEPRRRRKPSGGPSRYNDVIIFKDLHQETTSPSPGTNYNMASVLNTNTTHHLHKK